MSDVSANKLREITVGCSVANFSGDKIKNLSDPV